MADMQMQGNEQAWYEKLKEWQSKPENAMGLLSAGLTLMGGNRPGESNAGLLARGIGSGIGTVAEARRLQSNKTAEAEQTQYARGVQSRKLAQDDRQLNISQQNADTAARAARSQKSSAPDLDKRAETIRKAIADNYPLPDENMMFVDPEGYQANFAKIMEQRRAQYTSALRNAGIDPASIIGTQTQSEGYAQGSASSSSSPFPVISDEGWIQLGSDPELLGQLLARYPDKQDFIISELNRVESIRNPSPTSPVKKPQASPVLTPTPTPGQSTGLGASGSWGARPIPHIP